MWYQKEGVRPVINSHESFSFRIRRGWEMDEPLQENYNWEMAEDNIKGLADRGYNLLITHFSKGHGIDEEKEGREDTKKIADLCHKHGLKVGGYIRYTSLSPETLAGEVPDWYEKFAARTGTPHAARYAEQYWRYMPCPTSTAYLEYLDRTIEIGMNDIGLDCLHVDGMAQRMQPWGCSCERCRDEFKKWIYERYPEKDDRSRRFGISEFHHIEFPDFFAWGEIDYRNPIITDPVTQEWVLFRCETLSKVWDFIVNAAVSRNPECLVQGNSKISSLWNSALYHGVDLYRLSKNGCAGLFSEGPNFLRMTQKGLIVGGLQINKRMASLGISTFMYPQPGFEQVNNDPEKTKLWFAQAMAFNKDNFGVSHSGKPGQFPPTPSEYLVFHKEHRDVFAGTGSVYDTALYFSHRTQAFNSSRPNAVSIMAASLLIKNHVPFDYLFSEDLSAIDRYRAVVLPEIECLSAEEAAVLSSYVKNGGGLVIIGSHTGKYNSFRRVYHENVLQKELGLKWSESDIAFTARVGKGRVTFLKEFAFSEGSLDQLVKHDFLNSGIACHLKCEEWSIPINTADLIGQLEWAAQDHLFDLTLPGTAVAEFRKRDGRYVIHLVNVDTENDVGHFEIKCNQMEIKKIEVLSPDETDVSSRILGKDRIEILGFSRYMVLVVTPVSR